MKKKEPKLIESVAITDMSSEGKGIARLEGKVHFVKQAVPGDVADILVYHSKKNYAEARISQLITPSALRTNPVCDYFGLCGGCKWQNIDYKSQLTFKEKTVSDALTRIGKLEHIEINPIIGADEIYEYRNKLEFGFTDRRWLTEAEIDSGAEFNRNGVGFHVPESFSGVIDIQKCHLQGGLSNQIRNSIREYALSNELTFFDLKGQKGFLRNLMIRNSSLGETLVLLAVAEDNQEQIENIMQYIITEFPSINSLQYVINTKRNDTIYDLTPVVFHGKDHIVEKLGNYSFKINPKSFFQTNTQQAEKLYEITRQYADLKPTDVVYDLYTGVGSIALYVSADCKSVTGIEMIEEAIKDAKQTAIDNGVSNCTFYAGDVKNILNEDFAAIHGKPDVVITDPPRAGMHEDVLRTLLQLEAPKIVYVSCNPASQARDLELLSAKYKVTALQPVDMFPQTTHIENVVRLERI
jgi:23S rRNA (uracil1939-C5)-methyltransferase